MQRIAWLYFLQHFVPSALDAQLYLLLHPGAANSLALFSPDDIAVSRVYPTGMVADLSLALGPPTLGAANRLALFPPAFISSAVGSIALPL